MNNKVILWALVVLVVILGGYFLFSDNTDDAGTETPAPSPAQAPAPSPAPSETPSPTPAPAPTPTSTQPQIHEISMTDTGYSPSTLTIKNGDTVKFTNNGTKANWPASAPHPTHTDYPEFDPKQEIAVGQSWSFTFTKTGTWRFHDHLNATRFGSITVTE